MQNDRLNLKHLLTQIRKVMMQLACPRDGACSANQDQLKKIEEQIKANYSNSDQILKQLICNPQQEAFLKSLLISILKKRSDQSLIQKSCCSSLLIQKQAYSIFFNNISSLIKEIVTNSKLISEELSLIPENLRQLEIQNCITAPCEFEGPQLSLYLLLITVLEQQLPEALNCIFLRLYILTDSVDLILQKCLKAFSEASQNNYEQSSTIRCPSNTSGKYSSISASLAVFLERKCQEQKEKGICRTRQCAHFSQIKSDFTMCKKEERVGNAKKNPCCFIF